MKRVLAAGFHYIESTAYTPTPAISTIRQIPPREALDANVKAAQRWHSDPTGIESSARAIVRRYSPPHMRWG